MARRSGRPSEDTDARGKLLNSAREFFVVMQYEKISTRMIAEKAGVNVAMIRYYFGNKEGLFEAVIRETMAPVRQQIDRFVSSGNHENLTAIMRTYYQTMVKIPQFPRLMAQLMNMPRSDMQHALLDKMFREIAKPAEDYIFSQLHEMKIIHSELDPKLCKMTFKSLMIFPFLMPKALMELNGLELNEAFLNQLLEHNIKVMSHGFMTPETTRSTGEHDEN